MRRDNGLSLIELSAVVAILGIIAIVVVPNLSPAEAQKLDAAAQRVAEALRFARSEAMRTGSLRGVLVDTGDAMAAARDIAVFVPDTAASPFGVERLERHPVSRQDYDLWLDDPAMLRGVRFASTDQPFSYEGLGQPRRYLFFDPRGVPVYLLDGARLRLTGGEVRLAYGGQVRTIAVAPVSGVVTVQ